MMQKRNIRDVFGKYFLQTPPPSRIIELGTYDGEFTNIIYSLREEKDDNFDLITMDFIKYPTKMPEEIWVRNFSKMIFCEIDIHKHMDFVISLIKENTLILCDNGNKIAEVKALAPHLKNGCVIMAHDYFETEEDFRAQDEWPCCEITFADVADLGLEKHHYDLMKSAYWVSLTKKNNDNIGNNILWED